MNELEKTEEEKNKTLAEVICFTKDIKKHKVFRKFKTICVSCDNIRNNFINMNMAKSE